VPKQAEILDGVQFFEISFIRNAVHPSAVIRQISYLCVAFNKLIIIEDGT